MAHENDNKIALAYVPVLHAGYISFFKEAAGEGAARLVLAGEEVLSALEDFDYLRRKDALRALPSGEMKSAIEALGIFQDVSVISPGAARELEENAGMIIAPDEDVTRAIAAEYFSDIPVQYISVFLRWHRDNTEETKTAEAHRLADPSELAVRMLSRAHKEAERSADWWRHVGAVLAPLGSEPLIAHNKHSPEEQSPYANGDPRSLAKRGIKPEITTAVHAEGALIGQAARAGIKTEGAALYVTDFPCPFCARMIAGAGIKELYFSRGYAGLDSADRLRDAGIELYFVPM